MERYYERKIIGDLKNLFFDSSNRPKKTPLYESSIQRKLEKKYSTFEINYALKKLQSIKLPEKIRIVCEEKKLEKVGKINFYYPASIEKKEIQNIRMKKKITKILKLIQKYADIENTSMLGNHLHYLVKAELRAQGFKIESENTNIFEGKKWTETNNTLDIIARHQINRRVIGLEIKNTLDLIPGKEMEIKLKMCKHFEIIPVFACRWLKPYRKLIRSHGGFAWEFKKQLYPLGKEKMVETLEKKFCLPVAVMHELPSEAIIAFEKWLLTT